MLFVPVTLAFLLAVSASPVPAAIGDLAQRQSSTTCGNNYYSSSQVAAAASAACNYEEYGGEAGSSDYPHEYHNYEGFNFPVSGPWYEFPILESGVYSGGSPGADRVVINGNCEYAGAITHTGASGDDFVGCSGTS